MHRKLGFGFLRYPRTDPDDPKSVDYPLLFTLVDEFLKTGSYFDTAYTYQNGFNEAVLRKALVERHPRETYRVADKLPGYMVKSHDHCWDFLNESLSRCGLTYFDVYLLHGLNEENYAIAEQFNQFGFLEEVKAAGKALKTGFSFHDSPELLDRILTAHPEVDYVQLQINYLDWDSESVQSRACYETAVKHQKTVLVMEPVKGGSLVNLPPKALDLLSASPASYALRFAASFENIVMVLSGMSNMEQVLDNIDTMKEFRPLDAEEFALIERLRTLYQAQNRIPCTACRYCTDGCPAAIDIPGLFACLNDKREGKEGAEAAYAAFESKADACLECGQCEAECPQHLHIRELLKEVAAAFA